MVVDFSISVLKFNYALREPSRQIVCCHRRRYSFYGGFGGGISLWTIATHRVLQSVVGCRMISFACLLDVKAPDRDSISNQVLQLQGEFAFCVFRKYPQWFGFPVLGVPTCFPRWHSLHRPLHNSPTRGSHSSRLILFWCWNSYIRLFKMGKSFDQRWGINDICSTVKTVMKPQTI